MQHEAQNVDLSVLRELRPDEQLLWWGRPDPQHQVKKHHFFTSIFYGTLIVGLALLIYIGITQFASTLSFLELALFAFFIGIVIIILIIIILVAYAVYITNHKMAVDLRHTTYAITDQRIIHIVTNKQGFAVTSHTAEDIGLLQLVETDNGWGNVSYGYPRLHQVGAVRLSITDELIGIPHARMVEDILNRTFKQRGYIAPHVESPPASDFSQMQQYPPSQQAHPPRE